MRVRAIVPRNAIFAPDRLEKAVENALDGAALAAKADFGVTTQTWETPVKFEIEAVKQGVREVFTTNKIYLYVNHGTRVRYATMTPDFQPKTTPRLIRSRRGAGGVAYVRKDRPRPGIKARKFDEEIAKKWRKQLPKTLQRAIDAEFG